jgi:hypothetical protein
MEINSLLVLYTKEDCDLLPFSQINTNKILTLTPDAFLSLGPDYKNVIRSIDRFSNLDHNIVIDRVREIESNSHYLDYIKTLEHESIKEVFQHKFHIYIGMYERLRINIPLAKKYYYVENKNIYSCNSKKELIIKIITKIVFEGNYMQANIKPSFYSGIINFLNKISSNLLSSYKIIAYTGNHYGLPNIVNSYENYDKELRFVRFRGTKSNMNDIFKALSTLACILLKRKKIVFTLTPRKLLNPILFDDINKCAKSEDMEEVISLYKKPLLLHLTLTSGLFISCIDILKRIKPIFLIAHEMKYSLNASLADAAKQLNIDSYLLSHGTHVATPGNVQSNYEQKQMATGVLASKMAKFNVTQSPIAVKAIKSFFPTLDYIEYGPIMWGYNSTSSVPDIKKQKKVLRILHAGTFKAIPATRPWIFETSDEFYEGVKDLIQVVSKIENIFLTIRFRPIPECSLKWIKLLALSSKNVEIKSDGLFIDDLNKSDLLISNSSTTIEEALAFNKNVLLWGNGARYSHAPINTNDNRINGNANDKESLREEIILIRDRALSKKKLNFTHDSKIQKTVEDFVINSFIKNNN